MLAEHKKVFLSMSGAQSVGLEKGTIEFKNYFKQIPIPFKIYADFECNLESVGSYEGSYQYDILWWWIYQPDCCFYRWKCCLWIY